MNGWVDVLGIKFEGTQIVALGWYSPCVLSWRAACLEQSMVKMLRNELVSYLSTIVFLYHQVAILSQLFLALTLFLGSSTRARSTLETPHLHLSKTTFAHSALKDNFHTQR